MKFGALQSLSRGPGLHSHPLCCWVWLMESCSFTCTHITKQ